MIKSLGHVALGVRDLEKSLSFYRDLLGMKVIMELEVTDDRIARVIGVRGAKCKIVHLQSGGGILELFEYTSPRGRNKARRLHQYDQGLIHIGFETDDFHEQIGRLRERGVKLLGEPLEFRPAVWIAYLRGPDGEVCELRQR